MTKPTAILPHFIRIFSAGVLWTGLLSFIAVNIYAKANLLPDPYPIMVAVMASPNSAALHTALAQKFWSLGFLTAAERELNSLENPNIDVLGMSTTDLRQTWQEEPGKLGKEYRYWQSVVETKPDYRAGLIYTAGLAYELSRIEEGKTYLTKASALDPNNSEVKELLPLLSE